MSDLQTLSLMPRLSQALGPSPTTHPSFPPSRASQDFLPLPAGYKFQFGCTYGHLIHNTLSNVGKQMPDRNRVNSCLKPAWSPSSMHEELRKGASAVFPRYTII